MPEYWFSYISRLLMLWVHMEPSFGGICLPSYHKLITNDQTYKLLSRQNFTPRNTSGNILSMVLDRKRNRLVIGAKDYIFYVDDISLNETKSEYWKSDEQKLLSCHAALGTTFLKKKGKGSCSNYINFLAIYGDKLFVCGTNSLAPKYKLISLENLRTVQEEKLSYDVCSSRLHTTMVGDMTQEGELISGTYTDVDQPVISGIFVDVDGRRKLTTDSMHLNEPTFISSLQVDDSVYIFLMEKAIEDNDKYTPTVVRLCTGDNGGSGLIGENSWTTFRKSRLVCVVNRGNEEFHFRNIVDVVYDDIDDVFYASYTMFKYMNMHSAVCAFKRKDVDYTFSGKFLETGKGPNNIHPVDNGNFLFGCIVNTANLTKKVVPVDGMQPTNYLSREALTKAMKYDLMERKVHNSPEVFEFIHTGATFTRLVLDSFNKRKQDPMASFQVVNIGTESGNVLMVYKKKKSKPCIIKEIATDVGAVQRLLINEKKRILYVGSDSKVVSLNVDNCHIHSNKRSCVEGRNPLCGWSASKQQCVAIWNDSVVVQDLSGCPKISDFFGPWSDWSACEYSSQKYCLCRYRRCTACNTSLCNNGSFVDVRNCSVNPVEDKNEWLINGSTDGGWSEWSIWSTCNISMSSRIRTCTSPAPKNGGRRCVGGSYQCKSCPILDTSWTGWSSWGECIRAKYAYWNSTRTCSKPNGCPGSAIKILPCAPKWAPWSDCSCAQRVRHRMPLSVSGCNNCTQVAQPQYEVCNSASDCFTKIATSTGAATTASTTQTTTAGKVITPARKVSTGASVTTVKPRTETKLCKPVPATVMKTEASEVDGIRKTKSTKKPVVVENISFVPQTSPQCDAQNKFSVTQLIIILTVVIVTCFFACAIIIYLILRRTKHSEKMMSNGRTNSNSDRIPLKRGDFNPISS